MNALIQFPEENRRSVIGVDLATLIRHNMERRAQKGLPDNAGAPSKVEQYIVVVTKDDATRDRHQASSIVHKHGLVNITGSKIIIRPRLVLKENDNGSKSWWYYGY